MSTNATARPLSSRRTFLTAGIAAVTAGGATGAAATALASHPDAELTALRPESARLRIACDAAGNRARDIEDDFVPAEPPEALFRRNSDFHFFFGFSGTRSFDGERDWYGAPRSIAYLRTNRFTKHNGGTTDPVTGEYVVNLVRDEAAHERADEIVSSFDRWRAEIADARRACGMTAAQDLETRLIDEHIALREKIAVLPATTIEGLIVKGEAAGWCFGVDLEDEVGSTAEGMAASIVRDLVRLANGGTSA